MADAITHEAETNGLGLAARLDDPSAERVAQAHEQALEAVLSRRGPLSAAHNPFRSTGISYVPISTAHGKETVPVRIQAISYEVMESLRSRTIGQVRPPRKSKGMFDVEKKAYVPTYDREDPAFKQQEETALVELLRLTVLYGLDEDLVDEHGKTVWSASGQPRDEAQGLKVLTSFHWSTSQITALSEDIQALTERAQRAQSEALTENFS